MKIILNFILGLACIASIIGHSPLAGMDHGKKTPPPIVPRKPKAEIEALPTTKQKPPVTPRKPKPTPTASQTPQVEIEALPTTKQKPPVTPRKPKPTPAESSTSQVDRPILEELTTIAETDGYGYKYANLKVLNNIVQSLKTTPLTIEIPNFYGISSSSIIEFLKIQDFDITAKWKTLIETLTSADQVKAFETKQFPESFISQLDIFNKELQQLFKQLSEQNASKKLSLFFKDQALDAFLAIITTSGSKLMIRSTGKEDREDLANAGGNESIANVEPNTKSIILAISDVVRSYFGIKSLSQRLNAGDASIFNKEVFVPVLLQKMIGETPNNIPLCGVMFTEEPEGGIGHKKETDGQGRRKTTGITLIQAAYGHNTGVVNSLVAVDTYIAVGSAFYPIIRAKRNRLVPSAGSTELVKKENPLGYALNPALHKKSLITLKIVADTLEKAYGYPMDVEFVINNTEKTLYIVQARPIVYKTTNTQPSYFQNLSTIPDAQLFKGSTIGAAGGAVIELTKPEDCIFSHSIGAALSLNNSKTKLVLIGQNAPSTSHEATTFRGEGKPVIFVPAWDKVQQAFTTGKKIIFSPQQNCILIADKTIDLTPYKTIGWGSYPLPLELSIISGYFFERKKTDSPLPNFSTDTRNKFLSAINKDKALKNINDSINIALSSTKKQLEESSGQQALLINRMQETLKLQQNDSKIILNPWSVKYLSKIFSEEKQLLEQEPSSDTDGSKNSSIQDWSLQLKKLEKIMFTQDVTQKWHDFIRNLTQQQEPSLIAGMGNLINRLEQFGILSLWLHSTFANDEEVKQATTKDRSLLLIKKWIEPFNTDTDFLSNLNSLKQQISSFDVGSFADPVRFDATWEFFKKEILKFFIDDSFKTNYESANNLIKNIALVVLGKGIECFDTSIKAIEGSGAFSDKDRFSNFKLMLTTYDVLLTKIITLFPDQESINQRKIYEYKDIYEKVFKRTWDKNDLTPSKNFDVRKFTIGNTTRNYDFDSPQNTAEDVFMIIHQNLLICISLLTQKISCNITKPERLQGIITESFYPRQSLITQSLSTNIFEESYNIPLQYHSAQIKFQYDLKTAEITISLHLLGDEAMHGRRWAKTILYNAMTGEKGLWNIKDFKFHDNAMQIFLVVDKEADLSTIGDLIKEFLTFSSRYRDGGEKILKKITSVPFKKKENYDMEFKMIIDVLNSSKESSEVAQLALNFLNTLYKKLGTETFASKYKQLTPGSVASFGFLTIFIKNGETNYLDEGMATAINITEINAIALSLFDELIRNNRGVNEIATAIESFLANSSNSRIYSDESYKESLGQFLHNHLIIYKQLAENLRNHTSLPNGNFCYLLLTIQQDFEDPVDEATIAAIKTIATIAFDVAKKTLKTSDPETSRTAKGIYKFLSTDSRINVINPDISSESKLTYKTIKW